MLFPAATVVIDPGHGGKQPGARAGKGRYEETLTLQIAQRLKDTLTERGHSVVLTRTDDSTVSLGARSRKANQARADVMISIHANDSGSHTASGIETYFLAQKASDAESQALAERENDDAEEMGDDNEVLDTVLSDLKRSNATIESELLANRLHGAVLRSTGAKNRGIRRAPLAVLKRTEMAAVLVEVGFLTHPIEGAKLWTPSYQGELATGLADGVDRFLADTANGVVPELPPPSDVPLISLTDRAKRSANAPQAKMVVNKKRGKGAGNRVAVSSTRVKSMPKKAKVQAKKVGRR